MYVYVHSGFQNCTVAGCTKINTVKNESHVLVREGNYLGSGQSVELCSVCGHAIHTCTSETLYSITSTTFGWGWARLHSGF